MNHVMIDLETLGTKSDSVFLSIAAVQFDIRTGETGKVLYNNIELESALRAGRRVDADTIKWWLNQNNETMKKMFEKPILLQTALQQLTYFFEENSLLYPWGNAASFDLGMLNDAYNKLYIKQPWYGKNERCYRTVIQMLNEPVWKNPAHSHDPVYDCKYQISCLAQLNKELNFKIR
jgi:hypothetical protein